MTPFLRLPSPGSFSPDLPQTPPTESGTAASPADSPSGPKITGDIQLSKAPPLAKTATGQRPPRQQLLGALSVLHKVSHGTARQLSAVEQAGLWQARLDRMEKDADKQLEEHAERHGDPQKLDMTNARKQRFFDLEEDQQAFLMSRPDNQLVHHVLDQDALGARNAVQEWMLGQPPVLSSSSTVTPASRRSPASTGQPSSETRSSFDAGGPREREATSPPTKHWKEDLGLKRLGDGPKSKTWTLAGTGSEGGRQKKGLPQGPKDAAFAMVPPASLPTAFPASLGLPNKPKSDFSPDQMRTLESLSETELEFFNDLRPADRAKMARIPHSEWNGIMDMRADVRDAYLLTVEPPPGWPGTQGL